MASVSARSRPVMCSTPPLDHRLRRRSCWVCAGCRRLGLRQVARGRVCGPASDPWLTREVLFR